MENLPYTLIRLWSRRLGTVVGHLASVESVSTANQARRDATCAGGCLFELAARATDVGDGGGLSLAGLERRRRIWFN